MTFTDREFEFPFPSSLTYICLPIHCGRSQRATQRPFHVFIQTQAPPHTRARPDSRKWWIVFRPPEGAVMTCESNCLAHQTDLWQPLQDGVWHALRTGLNQLDHRDDLIRPAFRHGSLNSLVPGSLMSTFLAQRIDLYQPLEYSGVAIFG